MNKTSFLPALLFGAMLAFAPGCGDTDLCKDVECGTNGQCFEGECICDVGYEIGASGQCDTESRVKFYGNYNATESCNPGGTGTFSNVISSGSDITKINISNFADSALNVSATVDGTSITIPSQALNINGTAANVTGTGSISGTTVTLNYTVSGGFNFTCSNTLTR